MTDDSQSTSEQEFQNAYIDTRWGQLYELQKQWGDEAIKYLMLLNSGGAVATLSFIGAFSEARVAWTPKIALSMFFIGIVIAGIMIAKAFEDTWMLYHSWMKDVSSHRQGKLTFQQITKLDDERVPEGKWDRIWGYSSFGSFILGCLVGAVGLFCGL